MKSDEIVQLAKLDLWGKQKSTVHGRAQLFNLFSSNLKYFPFNWLISSRYMYVLFPIVVASHECKTGLAINVKLEYCSML